MHSLWAGLKLFQFFKNSLCTLHPDSILQAVRDLGKVTPSLSLSLLICAMLLMCPPQKVVGGFSEEVK